MNYLNYKYINNRFKSKGLINLLSAVSRIYLGGLGGYALSDISCYQWNKKKILSSFSIVQIQTLTGCNYSCSFCPMGKGEFPKGKMSLKLFEEIIKQLKYFEGKIHLYLMNEPLLDNRLPFLCRKAAENTKAKLVIQTNGSLLTKELATELTRFAKLVVNDYTKDNSIIRRVKEYQLTKNIILMDRNPEKEILSNRAGNLPGLRNNKLKRFCIRPFTQLYIAYNGKIILCCQDYKFESVMGNLNMHRIDDIWKNHNYHIIRAKLLNKERIGLCAKCDYIGV